MDQVKAGWIKVFSRSYTTREAPCIRKRILYKNRDFPGITIVSRTHAETHANGSPGEWTWCIASRIPEAGDMIYYDSFREVVWNIIKITDRNAALIDARKTVKGEGKVMEQHQANQLIKEIQKLNKTLTAIEKDIRAMRPREEPPVNVNHERDILVSIGILFGRGKEKDEALYAIYMNSFCTLFPNVMLVEEPEDEFLFPKAGKILAARVDDKSFFIATEKDGPDLPGIEDLLGYLRVRNVR